LASKRNDIAILTLHESGFSVYLFRKRGAGLVWLDHEVAVVPGTVEGNEAQGALKELALKHRLDRCSLCTVLWRHDVTTRILELPSEDPAELQSMVALNMDEYVPYAPDEVSLAVVPLGRVSPGVSRVLAVFAHKDVIDQHVALLKAAGLTPEAIFFSTACLMEVVAARVIALPGPAAVISLGESFLETAVFHDGTLCFTRGVTIAPVQNSETTSTLFEEYASEVRTSLAAFRRESNVPQPEILYLTGEITADRKELAEYLTQSTGLPCEWIAPRSPIVTVETEGKPTRRIDALPLVPLGAALHAVQGQSRVDFLPPSLATERKAERIARQCLVWGLAVTLFLVTLGGGYIYALHRYQKYITELESAISLVEPSAKGVAAKQNQLRILNQQVERKGSVLELLSAVVNAAPEGVNITRFTYNRKEGLNLFGNAKSVDHVHQFTDALRKGAQAHLHFFAQARSLYEHKISERGQPVYSYQIAIPFEQSEDESTSATKNR
jgi:Tfp pilus assembly PilM family ATPase